VHPSARHSVLLQPTPQRDPAAKNAARLPTLAKYVPRGRRCNTPEEWTTLMDPLRLASGRTVADAENPQRIADFSTVLGCASLGAGLRTRPGARRCCADWRPAV